MPDLKIYLRWPDKFYKNDSIDLNCRVNKNITDWKLRAELYDKSGNFLKLATANVTGGSVTQIEVTDATNGKFTVKIPNNQTDCFQDKSFIEIEREDASANLRTIVKRTFIFSDDQIEWTDNS